MKKRRLVERSRRPALADTSRCARAPLFFLLLLLHLFFSSPITYFFLCRSTPSSSQFCEDCGAHFEDSNHCTSTAHLLSLSRRPQPSNLPLGVPTSSPGFRLLLRGGWEPGMGLGPRGEGRANPIPTILKRDQEGLGYRSPPQPRVTHFAARDTRAVSGRERVPRVATLSQRENRRQEEKGRAWERDLRLYMNLEF